MNWIKARAWLVAGLAVVVVVGVVSPALGGPSLKKLVKREVAKQISKAAGPAGAPGTARAYGRIAADPCSPNCALTESKGISSVTRPTTGFYCVSVPGIDSHQVAAAVTVDHETTASAGDASAMVSGSCGAGFAVSTERQLGTLVCTNSSCSNQATVAGPATTAPNNVGFTIVIP
jgi:hypothetical protein